MRGKKQTLRLNRLRVAIEQGVAELDRGEYEEVEDKDLDAWLDHLAAAARRSRDVRQQRRII